MFDVSTDVLIVGSGPAGLTTAALLSNYGVENIVIEKYSWLANTPRAHITNLRTMEIMRELGIEDDIREKAMPNEMMGNTIFCSSLAGEEYGRLLTWGTHPSRKADYELASPTSMCDLPQDLMEPIILNAACKRGSVARFKTEYVSHTQDEHGVIALVRDRLSGGEYRISAKYLVGADGANSAVAEHIGLPMEGKMGVAGSMNIEFEADLTEYLKDRPSVLYWMLQPGAEIGGVGAGLIRTVRPWKQFLSIYGYDIEQGPPDLTEAQAVAIVHQLIGDHSVSVKLLRTSFWTINHQVASYYSVGRVFCMGDAVHRHPPSNGLGSNTSIQDAYNLAWKLSLVLKGSAAPILLATYSEERQPVGRQIVDRANQSIEDYLPIYESLGLLGSGSVSDINRHIDARKQPTAEAGARREALDKAIAAKSYEFNCLGVEMGPRYASTAVVSDGSPAPAYTRDPELYYHPTTWPGARIPHVWLEKDGQKVSSLDLVGRGRFTLITGISGASWIEAAARVSAELGVPIQIWQVGPGCEVIDTFGDWMQSSEIDDSGCLLIRPDAHIGFRAKRLSATPAQSLVSALKTILGIDEKAKWQS